MRDESHEAAPGGVRTVAGWLERMRGAWQAETRFEAAGVQGLMGGKRAKRKPRLHLHLHGLYACEGGIWIGFGDTPAEAWDAWRSHLPWRERWLVPHARASRYCGHVPPHAVPPPSHQAWSPTRVLPPAPPPAGWEPRSDQMSPGSVDMASLLRQAEERHSRRGHDGTRGGGQMQGTDKAPSGDRDQPIRPRISRCAIDCTTLMSPAAEMVWVWMCNTATAPSCIGYGDAPAQAYRQWEVLCRVMDGPAPVATRQHGGESLRIPQPQRHRL